MTEKNSRKNETVDALFDAILSLESREECYAFFEDLCTVKEISDMAQRLQAAKLSDHFLLRHVRGEKISLRLPVWNLCAYGAQIMRAAGCKPFAEKSGVFSTIQRDQYSFTCSSPLRTRRAAWARASSSSSPG